MCPKEGQTMCNQKEEQRNGNPSLAPVRTEARAPRPALASWIVSFTLNDDNGEILGSCS